MIYRDGFNNSQSNRNWIASFYRSVLRVTLALLTVLVVAYFIGFAATGGNLLSYKFWAPKQENARRQVFENTQSYVQGKSEYIGKLIYQYRAAEAGAQKGALKQLILSEAATVDVSKLPAGERAFLTAIGGVQ